jgi:L,D-peptidoglycan transpeptidase YkuD (ErfK/YbiS/YcfS/YnhG family)
MKKISLLLLCLMFIGIFPFKSFAASPFDEKKLLEKLNKLKKNEQVIIVTTDYAKARNGKLFFYQKEKGKWKKVFSNIDVIVGKNGITEKKREGDGKTPVGIYPLGTAFGSVKKPSGIKIPYRQTTKYDYWIDDPSSKDYNKWIHYRGNPKTRWKSFERLNHPLYKYAVVIRYNDNLIVKGKGSAIFLHIWSRPSGYTLGCVAMSEKNLLKIIQTLDSKKNPVIVINEKRKLLETFR